MDLTWILTLARLQSKKKMQAVNNQESDEEMSEFRIN